MRVAILEDDVDLARLVMGWLEHAQYKVEHFETGAALLNAVSGKRYDLLIFDWMLPGLSGLEVVTRVRASGSTVPVLFLTQFDSVENVATALQAGANDYLAKPVTRNLLLSRVEALIGVSGVLEAARDVAFGGYRTETAASTVHVEGKAVKLSAVEFKLAFLLFSNLGRLMTRSDLRRVAWQTEREATETTHGVDFEMSMIKLKLGLDGTKSLSLVRVHNLGYRLESA